MRRSRFGLGRLHRGESVHSLPVRSQVAVNIPGFDKVERPSERTTRLVGFDAQASFGLAEQAVALWYALEGRYQFDEQNNVRWSRVRWRWELNLFCMKKKACRTLPVTTGRGPTTIPCRLRSKACVACTIVALQLRCQVAASLTLHHFAFAMGGNGALRYKRHRSLRARMP